MDAALLQDEEEADTEFPSLLKLLTKNTRIIIITSGFKR